MFERQRDMRNTNPSGLAAREAKEGRRGGEAQPARAVAHQPPLAKEEGPARAGQSTKEVVLSWPYEGVTVFLAGSFNGWHPVAMAKNGSSFDYTIALPEGKHYYKYVVDGRWCYDILKPNETDSQGNTNNILTVDRIHTLPAPLLEDHAYTYVPSSKPAVEVEHQYLETEFWQNNRLHLNLDAIEAELSN
uniref:AMP-activated protein kinase glycogen-binding domain-containing protein n=1 Tax=Arcella intermedia TaxID=1963864 RepID=A0A6B2LJ41_9EUKA